MIEWYNFFCTSNDEQSLLKFVETFDVTDVSARS